MGSMPTTHLLYLHGFRSSPLSAKARTMAAVMARDYPDVVWWCPQLPPSPWQAVQDIMTGIDDWRRSPRFGSMAVIGSSLGGFYATWVAEKMACKAVLLNPAIDPARDLQSYIGEQSAWHQPGETFVFQPEFVDELGALHAGSLRDVENYLAVVAKGDEVLDWREMTARYAGATVRLLEGSNHALGDFEEHLPAILDFLDLRREIGNAGA